MSNQGAQINIKALIEFNQNLVTFQKKLNDCKQEMDNSITRLGSEWKDDKYLEFKSEFSKHVKKLEPLSQALISYKKHSEEYWIPIIEKFLNKRVP
jgi:uncharacterized protein YukE